MAKQFSLLNCSWCIYWVAHFLLHRISATWATPFLQYEVLWFIWRTGRHLY